MEDDATASEKEPNSSALEKSRRRAWRAEGAQRQDQPGENRVTADFSVPWGA